MRKKETAAVVLLLCLAASGCYKREPLTASVPQPNTRIVAVLTDDGAAAMGGTIGVGAMEVEGVVAEATDTVWTLQMVRVEHRDGRTIGWNREQVSFRRTMLANPTIVTLDRTQSWLVAGGVTIGALLMARAFGLIFAGDDDGRGPPGPPPQENVIPGGRR